MVTIVAVLVVTVASQARNTRQQQTDDNEANFSSTEFRHPRFISRIAANSTDESTLLKSVRALVMRVLRPASNETVLLNASGQIGQIGTVDSAAPGSVGASRIISNSRRK